MDLRGSADAGARRRRPLYNDRRKCRLTCSRPEIKLSLCLAGVARSRIGDLVGRLFQGRSRLTRVVPGATVHVRTLCERERNSASPEGLL